MNQKQLKKVISAQASYAELIEAMRWEENRTEDAPKLKCYYPELFVAACQKKLSGEIDEDYFREWLVLLCRLLMEGREHYALGDFFDATAFYELDDAVCREIISVVREHDTRLKHPDFVRYHCRKKMKVTYVRWEFFDHSHEESLYMCYIVDHAAKRYDVRILEASALDYALDKNFFTIEDEEVVARIQEQVWSESDEDIDCSLAERKLCDAEEELLSLFFARKYLRDKSLQV